MRQIKFRIWERVGKKLHSWESRKDHYQALIVDVLDAPTSDWIAMQFSGLQDKNGKEIYEGDIVQKMQGEDVFRYEVKFSHGSFGIEFPPPSYSFKALGELIGLFKNRYEVIGNIYQNPELLTPPSPH